MHGTGQVHVRLPADVEDALRRVMSRRDIPKADAVRAAIRVLGWFEDQRAEGRRVLSLGDDGVERELQWP